MLTIRKEQMELLNRYMLRQFEKRMEKHLQTMADATKRAVPAGELPQFIRDGFKKASDYGVRDQADVQRFLEFAYLNGQDFDARPEMSWTRKILEQKKLSGTEKMNQLEEYELMATRKATK